MKATPAVTVIVPVFDVERYVRDAVTSLKEQSFEDFEAVFVDDGSTDGSAAAIRQAAGDDARFQVVSQRNSGPATARNRALDLARGEYLLFLDADDLLVPNALERLVGVARDRGLDYLDFNARTEYEQARLRSVRDESFYEGRRDIPGTMTGPELFCAFQRNREYVCALWLHFVKRSLVERAGLRLRDGMYVHEDEIFSPLLIAHAERAMFLNEPLYIRRVRGGSAMTAGRGMRNVASLYEASCELGAWMRAHAAGYDRAFVAAMAQRVAELRELACADAQRVPSDELVSYSLALDPAGQFDFEAEIVQGALRRDEFYGSATWRAGEALLAAPQALRAWGRSRMAERKGLRHGGKARP